MPASIFAQLCTSRHLYRSATERPKAPASVLLRSATVSLLAGPDYRTDPFRYTTFTRRLDSPPSRPGAEPRPLPLPPAASRVVLWMLPGPASAFCDLRLPYGYSQLVRLAEPFLSQDSSLMMGCMSWASVAAAARKVWTLPLSAPTQCCHEAFGSDT
ncbi:uncharacterized protein BKA78DRAFT_189658 [Phyllosticta capitalensis]|uniref:uncharacterized protein n=1 Tax=Phyllosticta capitalensis TaxID=121624 RepID=UPI0031313750